MITEKIKHHRSKFLVLLLALTLIMSSFPVTGEYSGHNVWEGTEWWVELGDDASMSLSDFGDRQDTLKIYKQAQHTARLVHTFDNLMRYYSAGEVFEIEIDIFADYISSWHWAPTLEIQTADLHVWIRVAAGSTELKINSYTTQIGKLTDDTWHNLKITIEPRSGSGSDVKLYVDETNELSLGSDSSDYTPGDDLKVNIGTPEYQQGDQDSGTYSYFALNNLNMDNRFIQVNTFKVQDTGPKYYQNKDDTILTTGTRVLDIDETGQFDEETGTLSILPNMQVFLNPDDDYTQECFWTDTDYRTYLDYIELGIRIQTPLGNYIAPSDIDNNNDVYIETPESESERFEEEIFQFLATLTVKVAASFSPVPGGGYVASYLLQEIIDQETSEGFDLTDSYSGDWYYVKIDFDRSEVQDAGLQMNLDPTVGDTDPAGEFTIDFQYNIVTEHGYYFCNQGFPQLGPGTVQDFTIQHTETISVWK